MTGIINLAALPGYYYLYALYTDTPINNARLRREEYARAVADFLRVIQPAVALQQPFRKTWALRLFTERRALDRFAPEQVNEAWRQLKELVERIGQPANWPHPPPLQPLRRGKETSPMKPLEAARSGAESSTTTAKTPPYPTKGKSPIDVKTTV